MDGCKTFADCLYYSTRLLYEDDAGCKRARVCTAMLLKATALSPSPSTDRAPVAVVFPTIPGPRGVACSWRRPLG